MKSLLVFILVFVFGFCKAENGGAFKEKKYTKEEVINMIDSLLNLPTIDKFLVSELNQYIQSTFYGMPEIPGDVYYGSWNTQKINPYEAGISLHDSTMQLSFSNDFEEFVTPIEGLITSNYGCRDQRMHKGIDIDLQTGDKVVSAFAGMVRFAKREGGYGNVIIVRHYNGLETTYAHLSKIKVKAGQIVKAGQLLGLGGNTGHSEGSHLHFEIRFKGIPINPSYFISFKQNKLLADSFTLKKTKAGYSAFPAGCKTYKIHNGDSLYLIAQKYGTSIKQLKSLNGMNKRVVLRVGQEIRIS